MFESDAPCTRESPPGWLIHTTLSGSGTYTRRDRAATTRVCLFTAKSSLHGISCTRRASSPKPLRAWHIHKTTCQRMGPSSMWNVLPAFLRPNLARAESILSAPTSGQPLPWHLPPEQLPPEGPKPEVLSSSHPGATKYYRSCKILRHPETGASYRHCTTIYRQWLLSAGRKPEEVTSTVTETYEPVDALAQSTPLDHPLCSATGSSSPLPQEFAASSALSHEVQQPAGSTMSADVPANSSASNEDVRRMIDAFFQFAQSVKAEALADGMAAEQAGQSKASSRSGILGRVFGGGRNSCQEVTRGNSSNGSSGFNA